MQSAKSVHRDFLDCGEQTGQHAVRVVWTERWLVGLRSGRATAGYHYIF